MRNKKLIPFEIIEKAVAGDPEAIDAVLRHYPGHIKYLSTYRGHITLSMNYGISQLIILLYFRFLSLPFRQLMGKGNIKRRKGKE